MPPTKMEALAGATEMLCRVATVSAAVPAIPLHVAVIVVVPSATPVANPEALMVAVPFEKEDHVSLVRVCMLPSLYVPVAVYC